MQTLRWCSVEVPEALLQLYPDTRGWQCERPDGHLSVLVGREPFLDGSDRLLWHLSISHRLGNTKPGRYPVWDEIKDARYRFTPDEVTMVMMLPPRGEYVNVHPTTFHLWEMPC